MSFHSSSGEDPDPTTHAEPVSMLGRLARATFRHRGKVLVGWLVAIAVTVGLASAFGGDFAVDYGTPGSDSQRAQHLLDERFPEQAGASINVVIRAEEPASDAEVRAEVSALLANLAELPHIVEVADPYTTPGGLAPDGHTLLADLKLDVVNPDDMPVAETEQIMNLAAAVEHPGLDIALGGTAVELAQATEAGSEVIGFIAAALILVVTFGSVVAAGLPLAVAVAGLGVSAMLTGLIAAMVDVPDWSSALATMLGIAVGIDYTLLMVTRYREWRAAGLNPEAATVATLDTAGRAVVVAGTTVVISMFGLFVMGLSFLQGAAMVAIAAVLVVMVAAVTLFPALLGYLGAHVDRLRLPLGDRRPVYVAPGGHVAPSPGWARWSRFVARRRIPAVVLAVAALLALAAPFLGARFGFPDAGNHAHDTSTRQAYDMVTDGFGAGANGPLLLVADLQPGSEGVLERITADVTATEGVALIHPPRLGPAGDTALLTVIPETGPQHEATDQLVDRLRDEVLPRATADTGVEVHVGGVVAAGIDANEDTAQRLPFLIGGVVLVSMVLLMLSFRSIVIPITAAVMNLLSVAAVYGVVALVLDGGWFGNLVGVDTATPMPAWLPVIVFAVLFGLSMDYEVFLISRMREAWVRSQDTTRAIVEGLAGTARVITAAASIMVVVFGAFILSDDVLVKVIGVGMAAAILIDATLVRLLLVPAVMHWLGRANWWLPDTWERRLPRLHVEGSPEAHLATDAESDLHHVPVEART
ncbi:MMPL family transporter [Phytoactinopolyspora limicola]|uniref:MMPL family transporter n=1 Tax=Phytoactinopolyspora limicola TaxID=2715536 RepID=UPI00140CBFCC|nr:MMPL family transporter [Phytoactinopolyspora limicola]